MSLGLKVKGCGWNNTSQMLSQLTSMTPPMRNSLSKSWEEVKCDEELLQNIHSADMYKYFLNPYYMPSITDDSEGKAVNKRNSGPCFYRACILVEQTVNEQQTRKLA